MVDDVPQTRTMKFILSIVAVCLLVLSLTFILVLIPFLLWVLVIIMIVIFLDELLCNLLGYNNE